MVDNTLQDEHRIVALVRDLMFASRVRSVAPEAVVGHNAGVLDSVRASTRLLVVDLEVPGAVDVIRAAGVRGAGRVVAFAPHVREDIIAEARDAGADVLSRGAFVKRMPELVGEARAGA